jgi:hypothetical protein
LSTRHFDILCIWCCDIGFVMVYFGLLMRNLWCWLIAIQGLSINTNYWMLPRYITACQQKC